jgi:hypothetical protein
MKKTLVTLLGIALFSLAGASQVSALTADDLARLKLTIRIITPTISIDFILVNIKSLHVFSVLLSEVV